MRRGVTVTPRILVPVIPVRIGAAQQRFLPKDHNTFVHGAGPLRNGKGPKQTPVA